MRLDVYLVKHDYFESRHQAQVEIKHGRIKVDGKVILKPSYELKEFEEISLLEAYNPYVSQGGLKLEKALKVFNIDVLDKSYIDIGASTGGFTDCLLKHHAKKVITIDVGKQQLHESLLHDSRVKAYESLNFLDVTPDLLDNTLDGVMDVSFTSSIPLIGHAFNLGIERLIVLIKPQFENNKPIKTGIIKHRKDHLRILNDYQKSLNVHNIYINALTFSPKKGKQGNIEFLAFITKKRHYVNLETTINESHETLN